MSRRKSIGETHMNRTAEQFAVREKQEAKAFELGVPMTPAYLWNNKKLAAIWKKNCGKLLAARLLAYCDGDTLLELCKAEAQHDSATVDALYRTTWAKRTPFPAPAPPAGHTLAEFIQAVKQERESFQSRLHPAETVCLDGTVEYSWPDNDASTIAREYARGVVNGTTASGELLKRAAERFLVDLERGHERGIFWDPVEARLAVDFAQRFCGLVLMAWQTWVLAATFGFKRASGLRRFQEVWLSIGRKNGKTTLASAVALFLLVCDQEKYAEIFAAATAKEQSRIVWRDARRAVGENPELAAHVQRWAGELNVKETDSRFLPLASEERSFLGVRAHGCIADEVGVWADRNAFDTLIQSTVSRSQPLVFAITTAPQHKQTFCAEKFQWAEKILRGLVIAEHVFAAIYTLDAGDSYKDLAALRKANPSLGTTLREEHLQKQIDELEETPSGLNNFLQFHCNVTPEATLQQQGSIPVAKWDVCSGSDLLPGTDAWKRCEKFVLLNRDLPCFAGLDVGLTSDLTAFCLLWPKARFAEGQPPSARPTCIVQFFMPEVGVLAKEKAWNVPLSQWAREGWLTLLPGDMVDPRLIKQHIIEACGLFNIQELGFDAWGAQVLCAELTEDGAVQCVAVPQVPKELTAPCRELLATVHRGELVHLGNPCMAWNATNVVMAEDPKHGGTKPQKLSANEKIDGVSALVNAWHRWLANPNSGRVPRMAFVFDDIVRFTGPDGKFLEKEKQHA